MGTIICLIAMIILFYKPLKTYTKGGDLIAPHPFDEDKDISISFELYFLVYSVMTAMVFLGPYSLVKYAYWILFLGFLALNRLELKGGPIVMTYILFLAWCVISALFISSTKMAALMMIIKYSLPLFYLWLGYTAINDSDDLLYFMKKATIGMCVYALIIGGFSAKFLTPLYGFLNFTTGLFISYASLADYFSGLIVIPIGLFLITNDKKWIYASLWILLSTLLETVRTGLGGIFLASSFLLFTMFRGKAVPWIAGLSFAAVLVVFTVPSFRDKMFKDENVTMSTFSVEQANFDHIQSNARETIWDMNMSRFYYPSKITGSGLGSVSNFMKSTTLTQLEQVHSDYVQILCDLGLIGLILWGIFVLTTIINVIRTAWSSSSPFVVKLAGGMALGSCAGIFFSMAFDNVVTTAQQSLVLPFIMIGIYLKVKDLYYSGEWN